MIKQGYCSSCIRTNVPHIIWEQTFCIGGGQHAREVHRSQCNDHIPGRKRADHAADDPDPEDC
jgi:hypothetical protein